MANTASIVWPTAQPSPALEAGSGPQRTFYTQVSVSGPSVCTTVHRGESIRDTRATLTRDDLQVVADEVLSDTEIPAVRKEEEHQWGPWSLTQRELEVLQLLAEGATNGQISQRLYISPKTTKNHLAAIFQKLDVTNRTHALVRAVVMGLVTIE
ncbi:MAG TPA: response regulator transcription factor [Acidimicrobiales bacterium]|nr:response regulator transcription factor [Acidimicrobiales bacterium]